MMDGDIQVARSYLLFPDELHQYSILISHLILEAIFWKMIMIFTSIVMILVMIYHRILEKILSLHLKKK